jgi:cytochrome c biogenesis protein CcdA
MAWKSCSMSQIMIVSRRYKGRFYCIMAYALGMGSIMMAISIAISASNQTFIKWLRKIAPKMNIVTGIVLILDGSYLIYYNLVVGRLLL